MYTYVPMHAPTSLISLPPHYPTITAHPSLPTNTLTPPSTRPRTQPTTPDPGYTKPHFSRSPALFLPPPSPSPPLHQAHLRHLPPPLPRPLPCFPRAMTSAGGGTTTTTPALAGCAETNRLRAPCRRSVCGGRGAPVCDVSRIPRAQVGAGNPPPPPSPGATRARTYLPAPRVPLPCAARARARARDIGIYCLPRTHRCAGKARSRLRSVQLRMAPRGM
ncbi:hypothetical protein GGS23DRAFT_554865 [Durotheca rogersii]|uniref:uncharacterized protein n=1 Tax=Durotheca rogersii TaxID=419775 RepID=UPI0022208C11|nr:uncharacterized protein GGS23DRAFT_554865 [Durotheca rogersii]KAI5865972.1 hypothetical protein GGS23DRAFT_554865 [Durotheca rogersii]